MHKYIIRIDEKYEKELKKHAKIEYKSVLVKDMYIIESALEPEELLELHFIKSIELNSYGVL